jgi:hypothetical protein
MAAFRNRLQRYHARFRDRDVADVNRILELYGSTTRRRWRNAGGTCERRSDEIRYSSSFELTEWSDSGSKCNKQDPAYVNTAWQTFRRELEFESEFVYAPLQKAIAAQCDLILKQ